MSDHVLDIVQNSVRANATLIEIIVDEDRIGDFYTLQFKDNGCGMDAETVRKATNPFFTSRSTRKVGLGLPLLKQNALSSNGSFTIDSEAGKGTEVKAVFQHSHLDRPSVGEIWESIYLLLVGNPDIRLVYSHSTMEGSFELDSAELMLMLGDVSIKQSDIKRAVIEMIKNNLEVLKASK